MNKQTVEGKFDQVAGKIKEKVGEVTGNERLANAGAADQIKGAAKETWGRTKEAGEASRVKAGMESENLKSRVEAGAHDLREKVTTVAQQAKEKIGEKLDQAKHDLQQERENLRH